MAFVFLGACAAFHGLAGPSTTCPAMGSFAGVQMVLIEPRPLFGSADARREAREESWRPPGPGPSRAASTVKPSSSAEARREARFGTPYPNKPIPGQVRPMPIGRQPAAELPRPARHPGWPGARPGHKLPPTHQIMPTAPTAIAPQYARLQGQPSGSAEGRREARLGAAYGVTVPGQQRLRARGRSAPTPAAAASNLVGASSRRLVVAPVETGKAARPSPTAAARPAPFAPQVTAPMTVSRTVAAQENALLQAAVAERAAAVLRRKEQVAAAQKRAAAQADVLRDQLTASNHPTSVRPAAAQPNVGVASRRVKQPLPSSKGLATGGLAGAKGVIGSQGSQVVSQVVPAQWRRTASPPMPQQANGVRTASPHASRGAAAPFPPPMSETRNVAAQQSSPSDLSARSAAAHEAMRLKKQVAAAEAMAAQVPPPRSDLTRPDEPLDGLTNPSGRPLDKT